MIVLGVPGGGKTDNFVYVNLIQHQSRQEALIIVDLKGDSTNYVKEYLHKRNLGELTGMAAGALSTDHRVMIVGPGADEGNLNILWYIPTTKEAEAKVAQLEALIKNETSDKLRTALQGELDKAREDLVSLKRKQHQMAVKVGAAWAKAAMKQDELKSLGHSNPAIRKLYYQTIISGMLHLRLTDPDLPPLMDLRFINDPKTLAQLENSPSEFARETYKRITNLGSDERAILESILSASTVMLDDPLVQEFTRTNSLDYEALLRPEAGKMPWAVAVNMHLELNTSEILNPVFESGFEVWHEVQKYVKIHSPEIHSNKLFFLMDEGKNFATNSSSGKIHPKIEELVDVMRSLDARFLGSTQSPDKTVIPPDILGKVTLLIGSPDDETAEYVAKKSGITTRDMSTSSSTHQSMIGEESGSRKPSIGWGFTSTESSQWRDIIQLAEGKTAQEVPLIYPHNLTQLPRNLGIMIVPGLAPALYIPLNPRESVVLKALRRIEPTIEQGPVMDSRTPIDMAAQLSAPPPALGATRFSDANIDWKEGELTESINLLEQEKKEIEKKQTQNREEELKKAEGIIVVEQLIKGLAKTLRDVQEAEERHRREAASNSPTPSNP